MEHAVDHGLERTMQDPLRDTANVRHLVAILASARPVGSAAFDRREGAPIDLEMLYNGPGARLLAVAVVRREQVDIALNVQRERGGRFGLRENGEGLGVVDTPTIERRDADEEIVPANGTRIERERVRSQIRLRSAHNLHEPAGIAVVAPIELNAHTARRINTAWVGVPRDRVPLASDQLVVQARRADGGRSAEALHVRAVAKKEIGEWRRAAQLVSPHAACGNFASRRLVRGNALRHGSELGRLLDRLVCEFLHAPRSVTAIDAERPRKVAKWPLGAAEHTRS
jgi:hypothetical protein